MIKKLTFDAASVTSNDDSVLYKALGAGDRILKGCAITTSQSQIHVASGYISVYGRQLKIEGTESITVPSSSVTVPYNLVLEINMNNNTQTFKAITTAPTQQDISGGTGIYQLLIATFSRTVNGISNIFEKIPRGDILPAYPIGSLSWNTETRAGTVSPNITLPKPSLVTSEEIRYIFTAASGTARFTAPAGFKLADDTGFGGASAGNTVTVDTITGDIYEVSFVVLGDDKIGMIIREWMTI